MISSLYLSMIAKSASALLDHALAATIGPHVLAALAWAVVAHAGGAPGRGYDLVALGPVSQLRAAHRGVDADMRSIAVGSHMSRCLRRE